MKTNELLEAKYRVQRALADQAGDDLNQYAANIHRIVQEAARKHGLKLRYSRTTTRRMPRKASCRLLQYKADTLSPS